MKEADPELERLLAEEEEIERRIRQHHETPQFHRRHATEVMRSMLMPRKVKHRKQHRGRLRGDAKGGTEVTFGDYGIQALEPGWITARQIEAARIAMTRHVRRGGKVWINIFPDKPVTQKPAETRMGSGKGNPERWVAVVRPGPRAVRAVVRQRRGRPGGHRARHPEAADQGPLRDPGGGVVMAASRPPFAT